MNSRELTSYLIYQVQNRGRLLRPLINFLAWDRVAAIYIPTLVRRIDEALREVSDARCALIYDGVRTARIVTVDDLSNAATIPVTFGLTSVELGAGEIFFTDISGSVDRLVCRVCTVVANRVAQSS